MAMKINSDECTACGDCAAECPNSAIVNKGAYFKINADKCNECDGLDFQKCADTCAANCIDFA